MGNLISTFFKCLVPFKLAQSEIPANCKFCTNFAHYNQNKKIKMFPACFVFGLLLVTLGATKTQHYSVDYVYDFDLNDNRDTPKVVTESEREIWSVSVNLYKGANNSKLENVIFSPLSLTNSMVMLNVGVEGETAKEIQNLFKFGNNSEFTIQNQTEVLSSLTNQPDVQFVLASKIYANSQNAKLRDTYVRTVSSLGEVETLDFSEPRKVVAEINKWVNNQTQGKISNIVKVKDFNVETSAVLLNILYFKAPWKQPFNKSDTQTADFYVSDNETVQVEMMHISADFPFAELEQVEAAAVFLPYKGERFSMVIYLPWDAKKLSPLQENLTTLVPGEVRNEAKTIEVALSLPKFNISSSLDVKDILESLGVQRIFKTKGADFSRMSESPQFHVSKFYHNVFIPVNEEGQEPSDPPRHEGIVGPTTCFTFKVDHPFFFQLYDSVTGTVLCSGWIANPNYRGNEPDDEVKSMRLNVLIATVCTLFVVITVFAAIAYFVRARGYYNRILLPSEDQGKLSP